MAERKQYWPEEMETPRSGWCMLEARAAIALRLIEQYGAVAGKLDGEDTTGRARLSLQHPKELVARCFAIADDFMDEAELRGEVRGFTLTIEERVKESARLSTVRNVWVRPLPSGQPGRGESAGR